MNNASSVENAMVAVINDLLYSLHTRIRHVFRNTVPRNSVSVAANSVSVAGLRYDYDRT